MNFLIGHFYRCIDDYLVLLFVKPLKQKGVIRAVIKMVECCIKEQVILLKMVVIRDPQSFIVQTAEIAVSIGQEIKNYGPIFKKLEH